MLAMYEQQTSNQERVLALIAKHFDVKRADISLTTSLVNHFYLDSLELLDFVLALNDAFCIELPAASLSASMTVADLCEVVDQLLLDQDIVVDLPAMTNQIFLARLARVRT